MKRIIFLGLFLTACLAPAGQLDRLEERYDSACQSWDDGDYVRALEEYEAILTGPEGEKFFDRIAVYDIDPKLPK